MLHFESVLLLCLKEGLSLDIIFQLLPSLSCLLILAAWSAMPM